jgi:hypothetical protein
MTRKLFFTLVLCLPSIICLSQETDVQLWLTANIHKDFAKKFRLYYEQGYRRNEFLSETQTFTFETGGFYKPWKFLWIGPYYRYYNDFKGSSKNHLAGVLLLREEMNRFDLKSKTRYIYEFGGGNDPGHFLRERITAGYDIQNFKLNPFVASEFIFHLQPEKTETEQIRFIVGADYEITKRHSLEFYYRYSIEMNVKNPVNAHTIGIDYAFDW